jgi:hypothetical protein
MVFLEGPLVGGLSNGNKPTRSKLSCDGVRPVSGTAAAQAFRAFPPAGLFEVSGLPGGAVPATFFTGGFRRRFGSLAPRSYAAGMTDSPPPPLSAEPVHYATQPAVELVFDSVMRK